MRSSQERKKIAARNDQKGIHTLNKSASKELPKAFLGEVFHAERVKIERKNMRAMWRAINQAVALSLGNVAATAAVVSTQRKWHFSP